MEKRLCFHHSVFNLFGSKHIAGNFGDQRNNNDGLLNIAVGSSVRLSPNDSGLGVGQFLCCSAGFQRLGILIKDDKIITICNQETKMMLDFINHQMRRAEGFIDATDLVFRLFLSTSVWYLKYLKQVNGLIEKAKRHLDHNIDNRDLTSLSRLQDSLTYFATSIRGNETLLSKLKFRLPVDDLDAELIEDVNIEMNQAREMTQIYANILESTMDTYANLINNNMNRVMRLLTSLNMIIMLPTLVASLFGMNLVNGMEQSSWGFLIAIIISVIITVIGWYYFKKRQWL